MQIDKNYGTWKVVCVIREITCNSSDMLLELGVSRKSPAPIQPIGADRPAPPLQPTYEANASDQSAKGVSMPVQCSHQS